MALDAMTIMDMEPRLIAASDGSWLAVSGSGAPLSVGVFGSDPDDARVRFRAALDRHVAILRSGTDD